MALLFEPAPQHLCGTTVLPVLLEEQAGEQDTSPQSSALV